MADNAEIVAVIASGGQLESRDERGGVGWPDTVVLAFRRSPSAAGLVFADIGRGPAHSVDPNCWEFAAAGKCAANTQVTGNGRSGRRWPPPIATPERRIYALRNTHTRAADPQRLTPTNCRD